MPVGTAAAKKPAKKSARKSVTGKPFVEGADPRRGKGPAPGSPNAGRPKDEFKALCRDLASGDKTIDSVRAILDNPAHPQFVAALRYVTEHGYGKPEQPIVGDPAKPIEHVHRVLRWGAVEIAL